MTKEENKKEERPVALSVPAAVASQEDANGVAQPGVSSVPVGLSKPEHDYNEGTVSGASVVVPGVEHREGEGVSVRITPEDNTKQINKAHKEVNEPWWLSGETEEDGVKRFITLDDVLKSDPSLKSTLKGGDFLYNISNYRKEHNMPALEQETYRTMLGNHSLDKTAKQEKRDAWRHFLVDAIQPVSDVLKAAVAYGYGKAGRTYIPIDRGDGSARAMSDRMRRLEEVRAAQNWDAWANTFRNKERERLQQEAEARRAAAREQERQQGILDRRSEHIWKSQWDAAHPKPKSEKEMMEEDRASYYNKLRSQGVSSPEAYARVYKLTDSGNRAGGSGGGRGAGGGRGKSPAYPYYVGDKPYSQEHFNDAVLHALSLEYPREDMKSLSKRLARMTPEAKTRIFKKHGRIVK